MLHFQNPNCECVVLVTRFSETLLVKEIGAIPEEKLANKFCLQRGLQLPGWYPCLNCRDFDQPVHLWTAAEKHQKTLVI